MADKEKELQELTLQFVNHLKDPQTTMNSVKDYCGKRDIDFDESVYYDDDGLLVAEEQAIAEFASVLAHERLGIELEVAKEAEQAEPEEDVFTEPVQEEKAEEQPKEDIETEEDADSKVEPALFFYLSENSLEKDSLSVGDQGLLSLDDISFMHNIRGQIVEDEEFFDLVESVKEKGVTQPVSVDEDGILLAGYRRVEASKRAGFDVIPVYCQSGEHAFDIQASENLDRKDLCALDLCLAIKYSEDVEHWDRKKISKKFKQHETTISRIIKRIQNIPEDLYPILRGEKSNIALMALIELAEIAEEDLIRSLIDREGALKLKDIRALVASLKDETEEDFEDDDEELDPEDATEEEKTASASIQDTYWEKASEFLSFTRDFKEYAQDSGAKVDKNMVSDIVQELESLL